MKKMLEPELRVVTFDKSDVIVTSNNGTCWNCRYDAYFCNKNDAPSAENSNCPYNLSGCNFNEVGDVSNSGYNTCDLNDVTNCGAWAE